MATATVVTAWKDNASAYLAVAVDEGGSTGSVEYIGATPLTDSQGNAKSLATLKADLVAACQAQRNLQLRPATTAVNITGTVTL